MKTIIFIIAIIVSFPATAGKVVKQPVERQVVVYGKSVDYSLANLEALCASSNWKRCHTSISPKKR